MRDLTRGAIGSGDRIEGSFRMLRHATHSDFATNRVIELLGKAAGVCWQDLAALQADENWYDIEYEESMLDAVVGSMFVAWQTFLSTMVSAVVELDVHCRSTLNLQLSIAQGKGSLLRFGTPPVGHTGYTGPEIINAFANYFKHRDEWPSDWRSLVSSGQYTACVVHACGARHDSEQNLRVGLETLGVKPPFHDFATVKTCLIHWVGEVEKQARAEILAVAPQYDGSL